MNNKNIFALTILFCLLFSNIQAQFSSENIIDDIGQTVTFEIGDLDNDGDLDIVIARFSASQNIIWYENTDGQGNFGPLQVIVPSGLSLGFGIDLGDIDNDGDLDIVFTSGSSPSNSDVGWIENLDGSNNWSTPQVISSDIDEGVFVEIVDFDGDGDLDIIGTSVGDDKIAWYENLDGQGDFAPQQIILTVTNNPWAINLADIDQDGDLDLFIPHFSWLEGDWIENIDNGDSFEEHFFGTIGNNPVSIVSGDLDNDGDIDLVTAALNSDRIKLFVNTDGTFSDPDQITLIEDVFDGVRNMYLEDMDNDGDLDILFASDKGSNKALSWFENQNDGTDFSTEHVVNNTFDVLISPGITSVPIICRPADINNDGKIDVVAARYNGSEPGIFWYENTASQELSLQISLEQNVSCADANTCDGAAIVEVVGGTGDFTFIWSSGETESTAVQLCQGTQGVTISDGISTLDTFIVVSAPEALELDLMETFSTPVSCFGDSDGEAYVQAVGGIAPYSYSWTEPSTNGPTITNVPADNYTVLITDSNGCVSSFPIEIVSPDALVVDLVSTENPSSSSNDDGLIQINWTGGNTGTATYTWNPNVSNSDIAENLPAGNYSVTVTDSKGCSDSISGIILTMISSTEESEVISDWEIFPNPSIGKFNLKVELEQSQTCQIELFNTIGQSVYNSVKIGSSFDVEINLKDSNAGIYFLKMEINGKIYLKQVIIE